jgi:tetraacyldisaccharide 4'-kinase
MRAPEFWSGEAQGRDAAPLLQAALAPLSALYRLGGALKTALADPQAAGVPVICIGNITAGGSGKTPITRTIRSRMIALGAAPAVLLRGHGGRLSGPMLVDVQRDASADVGDEALLHAADGATFVSRDRIAGARAALQAGASVVLMDDGFQNMALHKDLSFLVFDGAAGFGNGRVLPAGPLREPFERARRRADALIVAGAARAGLEAALAKAGLPVLRVEIVATGPAPPGPLVAFAGIGRPQKFFTTLEKLGAELSECVPFADHHPYGPSDVMFLERLAEERGASLITTEKDHVRLPEALAKRTARLPVAAQFQEPEVLDRLLKPFAKV